MTHFDERAKDWDSDPDKIKRASVIADAIRAALLLSADMTALEYGCGTGLLSFALQSDLGQITLADTSQGMLDVLGEKIAAAGMTNMHPLKLDFATDPLPAQRFHITYSLLVMHHVEDVQGMLKKFHALLEADGSLVVADLDKEDGTFHAANTPYFHDGFARDEFQQMVEAAGFGDVKFTTGYVIHKKRDGGGQDYPVFLMTAQKK